MFTGWRGWSVDYLLPLAALAVICSMWVITAVQKLEVAEYMIYHKFTPEDYEDFGF